MFAAQDDPGKKLLPYATHVGKDRSEVINDLLSPGSPGWYRYDSRDRRAARAADPGLEGDAAPHDDDTR